MKFTSKDKKPFVIFVDDLVLLEFYAVKYGYKEKMHTFLENFIVSDIYKYCDIFVQIGTKEVNNTLKTSCFDNYYCYQGFSIYNTNVCDTSYKGLYIPIEQQNVCPEEMKKYISDEEWLKMHENILDAQQKKIKKQIRNKKKEKKAYLLERRKRYGIEANTSLLRYSPNIGLRSFPFSTNSNAYKQKNEILKKIYSSCKNNLFMTNVYTYMLGIKDDVITHFSSDDLEALTSYAFQHPEHWKKCTYNQNRHWTCIFTVHSNDSFYLESNHLKAYVALDSLHIEPVFIQSIEYLLKNASFSFSAKIAHVSCADQICYWIHPDDYTLLEDFFCTYRKHLRKDIPFMIYHNGIGISKDFREEISHNSMQAELITEYFKTISYEDEIQLSSMYQMFIDSWNLSPTHSSYFIERYYRTSALCFLVLMDTLGILLEEQTLSPVSIFFYTSINFWKSLEESHCWADLNNSTL